MATSLDRFAAFLEQAERSPLIAGISLPETEIFFHVTSMVAASATARTVAGQRLIRHAKLIGKKINYGFRRALQILRNKTEKSQSAKLQRNAQASGLALIFSDET